MFLSYEYKGLIFINDPLNKKIYVMYSLFVMIKSKKIVRVERYWYDF